jgi:hypothetical protein
VKTILIRIDDPDDSGYPLALFVDDGADDWIERPLSSATIPNPLPEPDIPQVDLANGTVDAIRQLLLTEKERSEAFEQVGAFLHNLIARDDIGRDWQELREADDGEGLRVLLDVRPPDLRQLPWELMRRAVPLPLFADVRNPCARVHRLNGRREPVDCSPLLRVLVVVGAGADDETVRAAEELEGLRDGLRRRWGLIDLELLELPNQKELEEHYAQFKPHIFHFIGHGRATNTGGELVFDGPDGDDGWTWTATAMAATLAGWKPRLAFVNACRSADQASVRGAWQIADVLLEASIPAVLGMQGDIRGDAAAEFTGAFYEGLAAVRPLDVAVVEARRAIAQSVDFRRRDPWLPCLWLSALPEQILPARYAVTTEQGTQIQRKAAFSTLKQFVDRTDARRQLWRTLNGDEETNQVGAAVAVVGPENVGKSGLVRWALGSSALLGANVAYVDLKRDAKLDFVGVLAAIETEFSSSPVHGEANRASFAGFGAATAPFRQATTNAPEDAVDTVFDEFAQALRDAAGNRTVVLALDHIDGVEAAHWRFVLEKLVAPVAAGMLPVQLIAVHRSDDESVLGDAGVIERINLALLPRNCYSELTSLYLRARGFAPDKFAALVQELANTLEDSWDAGVFAWLDQTARVYNWPRDAA